MSNLYSNQILALLQAKRFYLVKVRFKHCSRNEKSIKLAQFGTIALSEKEYSYKVPNEVKLAVGDTVIVNSPFNGYVTVIVTEVLEDGILYDQNFQNSNGYKWIVQKVDDSQYLAQQEREAKAEQLIKKHQTARAHQEAMELIADMFNNDMKVITEITTTLGAKEDSSYEI